ncbi:hypothetical protein RhoFasB10_02928 [Rhodococcus sp. B10]|nr:hypothetical protein [Rhodococcus sp. B10]
MFTRASPAPEMMPGSIPNTRCAPWTIAGSPSLPAKSPILRMMFGISLVRLRMCGTAPLNICSRAGPTSAAMAGILPDSSLMRSPTPAVIRSRFGRIWWKAAPSAVASPTRGSCSGFEISFMVDTTSSAMNLKCSFTLSDAAAAMMGSAATAEPKPIDIAPAAAVTAPSAAAVPKMPAPTAPDARVATGGASASSFGRRLEAAPPIFERPPAAPPAPPSPAPALPSPASAARSARMRAAAPAVSRSRLIDTERGTAAMNAASSAAATRVSRSSAMRAFPRAESNAARPAAAPALSSSTSMRTVRSRSAASCARNSVSSLLSTAARTRVTVLRTPFIRSCRRFSARSSTSTLTSTR